MKRHWLIITGILSIALPVEAFSFFDFPNPLRVGQIDWIRGAPEGGRTATFLSGSVIRKGGQDVNVAVPCLPTSCRHIEFSNPPAHTTSVLGDMWEVGKDHMVKGGFGPLAAVNKGLEPTGRKVIDLGTDDPSETKIVAEKPSEGSNSIVLRAYIRACIKHPFTHKWLTCTPYFIPTPVAWAIHQGRVMPIDIKTTPPNNPISVPQGSLDKQSAILSAVQGIAPTAGGGTVSIGNGAGNKAMVRAALALRGASSAAGPGGGREACAYMVNKVVYAATGQTLGGQYPDSVPYVEADLQSGKGTQVNPVASAPGDIVIAKGQSHIGICMNYGCTQILSNSSSHASFSWVSDGNFDGSYDYLGGTDHIYRLK